jgi:hypothetical protein
MHTHSPHTHSPHAHNPHAHNPHAHTPGGYYGRRLQTAPSEIGVTVDYDELSSILSVVDGRVPDLHRRAELAACTDSLIDAGAPLPCRTGGNPIRCFAGARACGTAEENTREPFVELDFHDYNPPFGGRAYLFEVKFHLPPQEEYGELLFHPPSTYGGDLQANRGWRMEVYDEHRTLLPVQCQDWNIGATATEYVEGLRTVEHACLHATATDDDYEVMAQARIVKITLVGEYRQVWLDSIDVVFRAITRVAIGANGTLVDVVADGPPPPPPAESPPPSPSAPPDPPSPPPLAICPWTTGQAPVGWQTHVIVNEPCHIVRDECCAHGRERQRAHSDVVAIVLDAEGCCFLVGAGVNVAQLEYNLGGDAGFVAM